MRVRGGGGRCLRGTNYLLWVGILIEVLELEAVNTTPSGRVSRKQGSKDEPEPCTSNLFVLTTSSSVVSNTHTSFIELGVGD